MRALRIWTDIVEWRWTPAVGLALGALSYVSLALLVIPDRIGDEARAASRTGAFQALRSRTSAFAASIAPSLTDSDSTRGQPGALQNAQSPPTPVAPPARPVDEASFPRRGFSPPLERVEPPPPPPPPPAPPPEPIAVPVPAPPPPPVASPAPAEPAQGPPPAPDAPPEPPLVQAAQTPQAPSAPQAPLPEAPPGQAPPPAPIPPH